MFFSSAAIFRLPGSRAFSDKERTETAFQRLFSKKTVKMTDSGFHKSGIVLFYFVML